VIKNLFRRPITIRFPNESNPVSKNYRGEHCYDINKCAGCGLCAKVCPNRAIEMVETTNKGKTKKHLEIDMSKCSFCGLCQDICPAGAIKLSTDIPSPTTNPLSLIKRSAIMKEEKDENEKKTWYQEGH